MKENNSQKLPMSNKESIKETKAWAEDLKKRAAKMITEMNKTRPIVYMENGHILKKMPDGTITRIE